MSYITMQGEWDNEPDTLDWTHNSIECHIHREQGGGHLCGYIRVPEGHKLQGAEYDAPALYAHGGLTVHGGLTYSRKAFWLNTNDWWLGFDCAHHTDLCPKRSYGFSDGVYRNMAYVKAECEGLADQVLNYKTEQTT